MKDQRQNDLKELLSRLFQEKKPTTEPALNESENNAQNPEQIRQFNYMLPAAFHQQIKGFAVHLGTDLYPIVRTVVELGLRTFVKEYNDPDRRVTLLDFLEEHKSLTRDKGSKHKTA